MANEDTRELILDSAEDLFALKGFHATSVRAITGEAGVNLASVNYHFGSKEALIEAVFERRFGPINQMRTERLNSVVDKAMKSGRKPPIKDVLKAFISPLFESEDGSACLGKLSSLIQMAHTGQDPMVLNILMKLFSPVMDILLKALQKALPGQKESELRWKMHFFIGGFSHTIRISQMHGKGIKAPILPKALKQKQMMDMMISFFSAGMEA